MEQDSQIFQLLEKVSASDGQTTETMVIRKWNNNFHLTTDVWNKN